MKLRRLCLAAVLIGLVGCAREHRLRPPELTGIADGRGTRNCTAVFPKGKWQFVHSIDFAMADGSGSAVLGVTNLAGDDLECALVTVEGLTLFEAVFRHDGSTEVRRAVPPFDGPEFAKGLLRDIRMIFQPPPGIMTVGGRLPDGSPVCRYTGADEGLVDVLPESDGCWQIRSYTSDKQPDRFIVGRSCRQKDAHPIPDNLELQAYGPAGYTLKMTLIRAERLP